MQWQMQLFLQLQCTAAVRVVSSSFCSWKYLRTAARASAAGKILRPYYLLFEDLYETFFKHE